MTQQQAIYRINAGLMSWTEAFKRVSFDETTLRSAPKSGKIDWLIISSRQSLSENFIDDFSDCLDWTALSINQELSTTIIRKYANKVNWLHVSINQNLPEAFIEEFADKVDWKWISAKQNLSDDFVRKWSRYINWTMLMLYKEISPKLKFEFFEECKKAKLNSLYYIKKYGTIRD